MQGRPDPPSLPIQRLTARELEVLSRTATGGRNADVADELGVSVHAVKFHLASIFRKLNVHNRTEAAAAFLRETHVEEQIAKADR
jgi:DNA-binding CsgD family transcriptional regulator